MLLIHFFRRVRIRPLGGFRIYNLTNVATRAIRAPMKTSIPPRLPIKMNPRTSRMMHHAGLETLPAPISARTPTRMLTIELVKKSREGIRGARFRRPLISPLSWRTASRIRIIPPITRSSLAIDRCVALVVISGFILFERVWYLTQVLLLNQRADDQTVFRFWLVRQ